MNIDVREYALRALEIAKADLVRDKYLLPVAFVVTDGEVFDYNLDFQGAEQKASVYRELVEIAKQKGARAIITINDATVKNAVGTACQNSDAHTSDANAAQECIFVSVSGPSIKTWSLCLPYLRMGNNIEFGNPNETENDILNLLPSWPLDRTASS